MATLGDVVRQWVGRIVGAVRRYRPTKDESGSDYDGPLSTFAEWHAVAIGTFFGLAYLIIDEPVVVGLLLATILGYERLKSAHLRDAAKEAGYTVAAFVAVWVAGNLPL